MESQGQGLRKAQTLRRKQQFGQHQGSQGSRPPPWQTAAYKVQGHSCDCLRPSLGSGSLAHSHPYWAAGLGLTPLVLQRLRAVRQRSSGPQG